MRTIQERFWQKVDKSADCWEWSASRNRFGYGKFGVGNKIKKAHRVAYELEIGSIPKGMCVLHKCDNRACVNPDHLWIGTQGDNIRDMWAKGRANMNGIRNPRAKLCELDVWLIKELLKTQTQQSIANWFSVARSTIGSIKYGTNWVYLERQAAD